MALDFYWTKRKRTIESPPVSSEDNDSHHSQHHDILLQQQDLRRGQWAPHYSHRLTTRPTVGRLTPPLQCCCRTASSRHSTRSTTSRHHLLSPTRSSLFLMCLSLPISTRFAGMSSIESSLAKSLLIPSPPLTTSSFNYTPMHLLL
ncbi:hypothetical protein [Absidia glauca]|uniref:Uncharacterized protein n=1 Tax=Absidia glauca TaxID=4829 RepID=A0A168T823_ABSGL|nr:hypothetical protein [Absidia glauca]